MTEILDTSGWKFYMIIIVPLIAAIILLLIIGYPILNHQAAPVPVDNQGAFNQTVAGTQITVLNTPGTPATSHAPTSAIPVVNTTISASSTSAPAPIAQTSVIPPVPFSLSVTPRSASARPGDTLTYTLDIQHGEGLTEPIHFSLAAKVLFFSQTYDLGTVDPPFPKSIRYDFKVPGNLPSGVTVDGVVTATNGAQTETEDITLNIL